MADGLIGVIRDRLPLNKMEIIEEKKHKWIKIYDMREEYVDNPRRVISEMEVVGQRISLKKERKKEKQLFGAYAAIIIQKNIRMWLIRKHLYLH